MTDENRISDKMKGPALLIPYSMLCAMLYVSEAFVFFDVLGEGFNIVYKSN